MRMSFSESDEITINTYDHTPEAMTKYLSFQALLKMLSFTFFVRRCPL